MGGKDVTKEKEEREEQRKGKNETEQNKQQGEEHEQKENGEEQHRVHELAAFLVRPPFHNLDEKRYEPTHDIKEGRKNT